MKVPLYEWEFYVDQKNERKQVIADVDHQMSVLLQKHNKRAQLLDDRMKVTLKKQKIQDDLVLANMTSMRHYRINHLNREISLRHYKEIIIVIQPSLKWQIGLILLIVKSQHWLILY